jgi:hypothetical protein
MKRLLVLLSVLGSVVCSAQPTTGATYLTSPNLLTTTWSNTVTGAAGGTSGGPTPAFNPSTNTIIFSYSARTVAQTYAFNQALQSAGLAIGGYDYSWKINNSGMNTGTLAGKFTLTALNGMALHTQNYTYNESTGAADNFVTHSGTQWFPQNHSSSNISGFTMEWTGSDNRFWAGYWGPRVREPSIALRYIVDACAANPMSSPECPGYQAAKCAANPLFDASCSGYNNIVNSANITAQSYAINQALNLSGAGVQIHGLKYGYHYYVGGDWCSSMVDGACVYSPSSMAVDVGVSATDGTNIYTATHNHTEQNAGGNASYTYVFPTQRLLSTMGNFSLSTREVGATALYSSWSNWQYTPDPCTINPLSSTACPGYQTAYFEQQCTANPLYAVTCSGYAAAYLSQQCTANQLYNPSCPGYAVAYKTQQCTANPLYATDCPGYEQAYLNAQCIIDSLYSRLCSGYATAYAIKYLVPMDSTTASAVNGSLSATAAVKAQDPVSINTNGTVSTGPSATGNATVDSVISTPSTTSATSPTSMTSVINTPPPGAGPGPTARATEQASAPPPPPPPAAQQERAAENKKTEGAVASVERRAGGNPQAARQEAAARAKELVENNNRAATLEAQAATQGLVVGLIGFVPGFSAYQNAIVPDVLGAQVARQYHKPTVDNRSAQRQLSGGNELRWRDMVDSQYNRGK